MPERIVTNRCAPQSTRTTLVTGGAGFIGSHLTELLLAQGDRVLVLDDLSTGSRDNVASFAKHPALELVLGRVEDESVAGPLVERADRIIHLAAAVGVKLVIEKPVESIERNVIGTSSILRLASRSRTPVLVASSSEVYGATAQVPCSEDAPVVLGSTTRHRFGYACSKAVDEFLAFAYHKERGLPVVVVRLFNTVGPRQTGRYGMVLPTFVRAALEGEAIPVHGDGSQSRSFCHVADTCRALVALTEEPRAVGDVFNIGADVEVTIEALAERVKSRLRADVPIEHVPYERVYGDGFDDFPRRVPSIEKIRALLGWRPTRTLDDVIDDVAAWERGASAR